MHIKGTKRIRSPQSNVRSQNNFQRHHRTNANPQRSRPQRNTNGPHRNQQSNFQLNRNQNDLSYNQNNTSRNSVTNSSNVNDPFLSDFMKEMRIGLQSLQQQMHIIQFQAGHPMILPQHSSLNRNPPGSTINQISPSMMI